jgi:hypothetical protein
MKTIRFPAMLAIFEYPFAKEPGVYYSIRMPRMDKSSNVPIPVS